METLPASSSPPAPPCVWRRRLASLGLPSHHPSSTPSSSSPVLPLFPAFAPPSSLLRLLLSRALLPPPQWSPLHRPGRTTWTPMRRRRLSSAWICPPRLLESPSRPGHATVQKGQESKSLWAKATLFFWFPICLQSVTHACLGKKSCSSILVATYSNANGFAW